MPFGTEEAFGVTMPNISRIVPALVDVSLVDLTTTATQPIWTNTLGGDVIITQVLVGKAQGTLTLTTFSLGWDASTNNVVNGAVLASLLNNGLFVQLPISTGAAIGAVGKTLNAKVAGVAVGGSCVLYVVGFYV